MTTPSEYFGLFLTELRNNGTTLFLSDRAIAELIRNGLEILDPDSPHAAMDAEILALELDALDDYFISDNGIDQPDDEEDDEEDDDGAPDEG